MKMNINYNGSSVSLFEALLFNRDSLNDFAIPFRRGRVETGSK